MAQSKQQIRIYVIAGEASGDVIGSAIVRSLREIEATTDGRDLIFRGIGGETLAREGVTSLFPMDDLSVAGIGPVIARLPLLIRRINQTVADIEQFHPDVVVTIDSPDFCFRVAKRARKSAPNARFIHVGAPTVWAWRPGRAKTWRAVFDHVLALLPFEPDVMQRLGGPRTTYIGHPLLENEALLASAETCTQERDTLLLMPGSRRQEVRKHLTLIAQTLDLVPHAKNFRWVVPTIPARENEVRAAVEAWPSDVEVIIDAGEKIATYRRACAAIVASGTASLELALAGIPAVVIYRASPLWELLMRINSLPFVALPNIIAEKQVMPEAILRRARASIVAAELSPLLENFASPQNSAPTDSAARASQIAGLAQVRRQMHTDAAPSAMAARAIIEDLRT